MEQPIYLELGLRAKMQALVRNMGNTALHHLSQPETPELQAANITYFPDDPGDNMDCRIAA